MKDPAKLQIAEALNALQNVLRRPTECSESQSRGKRVGWDECNESQFSGLFIAEIRLRLIPAYGLPLSREFILGRLHGPRWFAWFTGVVLLWFVFALASVVTGWSGISWRSSRQPLEPGRV
jgi:hypothetical protein